MESSLEIEMMETSQAESPTEVEPSSQVEPNVKESLSGTEVSHKPESPKVEQLSKKISSMPVPIPAGVGSPESASSPTRKKSSDDCAPIKSPEVKSRVASAEALPHDATEKSPMQKKQCLDYKNMPTGSYLDATVVPILHIALLNLDRLRPADPLQFVIDFLLKNKDEYNKKMPDGISPNEA